MALRPEFPVPGCIVEYLEDNQVQIAFVLEESGGKLRLLSPARRESKLSQNRLLPWSGPVYPVNLSREDAVKILEEHKARREKKAETISSKEVWELAQGEISQAPASWFAELFENDPDIDIIAAYGRALLNCKTHFRFQPPDFLVHDAETAEKKLLELKQRQERDALIAGGASFLRLLWEIATRKKSPPADSFAKESPPKAIADRIESILRKRMINPDSQETDSVWQEITKGLPDLAHLPLQLLTAWGKLPPHYDFWLERAAYEPGDAWWMEWSDIVTKLEQVGLCSGEVFKDLNLALFCDKPFISIDGASTKDIDDAFHIERTDTGYRLTMAFACPAIAWPFGSGFDKKIQQRATSIYLPEGDMHMLPEALGADAFSLWANKMRPAFCCAIELDTAGKIASVQPFLAAVKLAANLRYHDVQRILTTSPELDNPATSFGETLKLAYELSSILEKRRIEAGAVIMQRQEAKIILSGEGEEVSVNLEPAEDITIANSIVAEFMVLASSALADWAFARNLPLIHRTQNITIPKEYAGIWKNPADQAQIMRSLMPSILEVSPRPHAALGCQHYTPVTSPLRRYTDLLNEAQIINYLQSGQPLWTADELNQYLNHLSPVLEAVSHVQKFRIRYWKLLYLRQKGDKCWWDAIITDENEHFVMVSLPEEGLFVRGKRELFDERAAEGMKVSVRLGKINPLYNEVQILETMPVN